MSTRVAVAATSQAAVDAALSVGQLGGSAVDAAIAAMVVAMSTEPGVVSPLGGAYVSIWPAHGQPEVIDGNVEMPGRDQPPSAFGHGLREVSLAYGGGVTVHGGHGSVATPGAFAALGLAHQRHGAIPWHEVMAPAARVMREGYPLGGSAASYLAITHDNLFGWDPETHALIHDPAGNVKSAGDTVVDLDLAEALETIGRDGAETVYRGDIAHAIAADMATRGGLVTRADLSAYRAVVRPPLMMGVGAWTFATNPPPSVGGPMLKVMLSEATRRAGAGQHTWREVIDIQRRVLSYRHHVHDRSANLEEDGYRLLEQVERHGLASLPTSSSTAHVSVVDAHGTACAITASSGYGSGATVPGTGLMLNNCLGEPELNRLGLHVLAPGTRLASNMAPTVGRSGSERMAIGSPGADRITTALMQVLVRYALMGVDLADAIDRPRLHVRLDGGRPSIEFEQDADLAAAVSASGLPAHEHLARSMYFGGVGAAQRLAEGELRAAADVRRQAATGVTSS